MMWGVEPVATSKEYLSYILDQLSSVDGITHRGMMGEYTLYINGRLAAYLCDDRLLIMPLPAAQRLLPNAPREAPYPGAKDMLLVEETDDADFLVRLFEDIYPELPAPKAKKSGS